MSLKISWGCLGVCLGLPLDVNLTLSGSQLHGDSAGPEFLSPHILASQSFVLTFSGSVLEAVNVLPLNPSLSESSSVPLGHVSGSLHTSAAVFTFSVSFSLTTHLSASCLCGFYLCTPKSGPSVSMGQNVLVPTFLPFSISYISVCLNVSVSSLWVAVSRPHRGCLIYYEANKA